MDNMTRSDSPVSGRIVTESMGNMTRSDSPVSRRIALSSLNSGPQKMYTDQELEKFLLDYCAGLNCPIPELNIYQLDPDEIRQINSGNEMYFLVHLERNLKGVIRSFNKNGWRQKKTLEPGMFTDRKFFRYYRKHDMVEYLKMIEFSLKENPQENRVLSKIIYSENKGRKGKSKIVLEPSWTREKVSRQEATLAPTPALPPSPREVESMILMPGPRVVMSGLSLADCHSDDCVELGRLKIELHQKGAEMENLVQALGRESDQLRNVSHKYENDKKLWAAAISNLEKKIKAMKQELALLSLEAHDCANAIPDFSKIVRAVQALVAQCEDLKLKYYEEIDKRKKLHNIVQEIKGNIRVFCRCRPLSKDEVSSGQKYVVDFDGSSDGDIVVANGGTTKKTFKFDRFFTPNDDQDIVYADASPLVTSVLDGYNVCIFAYGQTGTGKTFTMEGTESNRGVNYRTLEELFNIAEERKESFTYDLSVSVLEVYNEQIRDLLSTSPSKKLEIKLNSEGQNHVPGLVEAKIENINEVWKVLQTGSNARAVGSNNVNEHSSRSHCMLCIMVRAKNLLTGGCTNSKLWLVDLAGNERLAKTDVQGERLKEAQNINKSISALGDVISALSTKSSHIPYRNSKLTHLLQDSLGGGSKVLMFVQISPSDNDVSETLSSLKFASRVRHIELGPAKKQVDTFELQETKQMLERAKQELRLKDDSLRKLEEDLQNLETKAKGKEQLCKKLQEKVKELEGQLDSKAHPQITSEKQQRQLFGKLKEKEEICTALQQKIVDLECKLRQPHQSESEVALLKKTIKELEVKLKEQERDRSVVELSIKELELRQKEQEYQRSVAELKDDEKENHISFPPEAPEAGNEKKRKGDAGNASIGCGEQENNGVLPGGKNAGKSTGPPPQVKNLVRSMVSSRAAAAATHKVPLSSRVAKQQPGRNKTRGWGGVG